MEVYAETIYQCLCLIRTKDKHLWPISHRERAVHYRGPEEAIEKKQLTVPAVVDVLAYLSVRREHGRVALTFATSPTHVTLYVCQDEPRDPKLPDHILNLWSLLRRLKEAIDTSDAAKATATRKVLQIMLFRACMHRVVEALQAQRDSYKYYTDTMRGLEGIEEAENLERVLGTIDGLYDTLMGRNDPAMPFSDEDCVAVAESCSMLAGMLSTPYPYAKWYNRYCAVAGLYCAIHYLSLIPSSDSPLRDLLSRPPQIVMIPTSNPHDATFDASPEALFDLLHDAVQHPSPSLTFDQFRSRLADEIPQLEPKAGVTVRSSAHCECALAVHIYNNLIEPSHMGISSQPCYPCSLFLTAYKIGGKYLTNTFDQLYSEEFELPWVLPSPLIDISDCRHKIDEKRTSWLWKHMLNKLATDMEMIWSRKGQSELDWFKQDLTIASNAGARECAGVKPNPNICWGRWVMGCAQFVAIVLGILAFDHVHELREFLHYSCRAMLVSVYDNIKSTLATSPPSVVLSLIHDDFVSVLGRNFSPIYIPCAPSFSRHRFQFILSPPRLRPRCISRTMTIVLPDDRSRKDAYAKTIYQCLHLIRANDKYIWPISHNERATQYHGPENAIKKQKISSPAVIDVLAYFAVRHGRGRVALTFATSPTNVALYVAQNEPVDPDLPKYILDIWSLLLSMKEALDYSDSEKEAEVRGKVRLLLYRACAYRIMDAFQAQRASYLYFSDTMRSLEVAERHKLEDVLRLLDGLYDLLDGRDMSVEVLSEEECNIITQTCVSLARTFSEQYPYDTWFKTYAQVVDMRTLFRLSTYVMSILQLPRTIHYITLLPAHDSSLRNILVQLPEITVIPTHDHYGATIDVTPNALFSLLQNAVDYPTPLPTSDQFHYQLIDKLPFLEGKTEITIEGSTHCLESNILRILLISVIVKSLMVHGYYHLLC
ncbi:hypothetical protein K474DRAFT_1761030 [Panus rudis PR-1116 ss-1]|nr:hypothetical protein K474DRAFT_1761030 [Panus rudis PR-1116 ss-1]